MSALEKEIQINKGHTNLVYYNKDRSSSFFMQTYVIGRRILIAMSRHPLTVYIVFLALYVSLLINSICGGVGFLDEEQSLKQNWKTFGSWLGMAFYFNSNTMAQTSGLQVI